MVVGSRVGAMGLWWWWLGLAIVATRGISAWTPRLPQAFCLPPPPKSWSTLKASAPGPQTDAEVARRPLPVADGVVAAAKLLKETDVVRTPLLESPLVNAELTQQFLGKDSKTRIRLLVKAECLQRTGSFKYRGATHRLLKLVEESEEVVGVVAFSSGNFGQALAAAASALGIPCTIVAPHDAPALKLDRIHQCGATLELSEAPPGENREVAASKLAEDLAADRGLTLLHPFDDPHVICGQGTCGMEILEQAKDLLGEAFEPDVLVVPCGGGGLTAGINLAVEALQPVDRTTRVYTVEPIGFDDHKQSYQNMVTENIPVQAAQEGTNGNFVVPPKCSLLELYGSTEPPPQGRSVFCDALMAGAPGDYTWSINQPRLEGALESLGDDSAARAMKLAFDHYRLVLEPSGALALAAVLDGQIPLPPLLDDLSTSNNHEEEDKTISIVVVASGGNTDMETFAQLMGCTNNMHSEE